MNNKIESASPINRAETNNQPMSIDRVEAALDKFEKIRDKAIELYSRNNEVYKKWEILLAAELEKPVKKQDARLIAKIEEKISNAESAEKQLNDTIIDSFEKINALNKMWMDIIDTEKGLIE